MCVITRDFCQQPVERRLREHLREFDEQRLIVCGFGGHGGGVGGLVNPRDQFARDLLRLGVRQQFAPVHESAGFEP
jgi:hypothetical protein